MIERRFALEVEHGVDDVFERARPGDAAALGHVAYQHHGGPRFLGEAHQPGRALAHLPHVARGALELVCVRGLDRVDEDDARLERRRVVHDRLESRLAEHVHQAGVVG